MRGPHQGWSLRHTYGASKCSSVDCVSWAQHARTLATSTAATLHMTPPSPPPACPLRAHALPLQFSAQYRVRDDGAYDAFYSLTEPRLQISSYGVPWSQDMHHMRQCTVAVGWHQKQHCIAACLAGCSQRPTAGPHPHPHSHTHSPTPAVLDAVTSACAHMTIDEVFASKASIAHSVRSRLTAVLASYGYTLIDW